MSRSPGLGRRDALSSATAVRNCEKARRGAVSPAQSRERGLARTRDLGSIANDCGDSYYPGDVEEHRQRSPWYLRCAGRGGPTVILESGIHDSSDVWTLSDAKPPVVGSPTVFSGIARFTRVCMYDRPGTIRYTNPPALTTRSSPAPMPRTLQSMVTDLHALLHRAGRFRGRKTRSHGCPSRGDGRSARRNSSQSSILD